MSKILISGGTGLVGKKLTEMLVQRKHEVAILSRNPKNKNEFKWDISSNYIDENALKNTVYIIHLAGASIADKRWTKNRKQLIIDSRVESANLLFRKVRELKIHLKGFISASAIGFYGTYTSSKIFIETDNSGNDFLAEVCKKWEAAALQFKNDNTPTTILRTGIVLTEKGGALAKMDTPIITPLGNGKQFISWIHIEDLCLMYIKAIEDNFHGIYNAIAPDYQTNCSFSKLLAQNNNKPYLRIGVPSILLKIMFGKMSVILLEGSRVSAKKIEKNNYSFRFSKLQKALSNLK